MKGKIKVAHIITLLEFGGAQQNTLYTVKTLNREKFQLLLFSGKGGYLDDELKDLKDVKIQTSIFLKREIRPWYDILAFLALLFFFLKEKPHIIHTHSSKAGILARLAGYISGVPIIIHTFHGFGFNRYQSPLTRIFFIFLEKLVSLVTTAFIMVSRENMKEVLNLKLAPRWKLHLIRSGVKFSLYRDTSVDKQKLKIGLGLDPNDKVVTMICPFKPQKDPLSFIEVARVICSEKNNVKFLLVGDGELREKIEEKISEYNLNDKVKLLSWRKDVPQILKITDVFLLTSLWEGLPRSLVEAMLSGVPVIASDVDGARDIINDGVNGFLVKPKDIDMFADRVNKILNDDKFATFISNNAIKTIDESFDIDNMVKVQEELYFKLLKIKTTENTTERL